MLKLYQQPKYQLLTISLITWPSILIATTILGLQWSEYNLVVHTISTLASVVAPTRFIMAGLFVIEGLLLILYGIKLNQVLRFSTEKIQVGHIIITSGTLLIALAFAPGGESMGVKVQTQELHNAIAGLLYLTVIIAPFVFFWRMRKYQEWHPSLKFIMIVTGLKLMTLLGSVIAVVLHNDLLYYAGLMQKLGVLLDAVWTIFLSWQLLNLGLPDGLSLN